MKKIFIFVTCSIKDFRDEPYQIIYTGLCEDGEMLAAGVLPITTQISERLIAIRLAKEEQFKKHCPEGFELRWVELPEQNIEVQAAYTLHKQKYHKEEERQSA